MNPTIYRNTIVGLTAAAVTLTAVVVGVKATTPNEAAAEQTDSSVVLADGVIVDEPADPQGVQIVINDSAATQTDSSTAAESSVDEVSDAAETSEPEASDPEAEATEPEAETEDPAEGTEPEATEPDAEASGESDGDADTGADVDLGVFAEWLAENGWIVDLSPIGDDEGDDGETVPEVEIDLSWLEDWLAENGSVVDIDELIVDIDDLCDLHPKLCDPDFWVEMAADPFDLPLAPESLVGPCPAVICDPRIPTMTIPQPRF